VVVVQWFDQRKNKNMVVVRRSWQKPWEKTRKRRRWLVEGDNNETTLFHSQFLGGTQDWIVLQGNLQGVDTTREGRSWFLKSKRPLD